MKRTTCPGEVPYYIAVFLTSFMQLGLFIHFQRWITFNSEGARFFWLSLLLQFAMFSPSIIMMHVASYFAGRFPKSKVMGWTSIGMAISVLLIAFFFGDRLDFGAFAFLFLYGIFLSIFNPAKIGLMKEITDGNDLVKINAKHLIFMALGITIISFLTFDYSPNDSSTISYSLLPFILSAVGLFAAISSFCIRVCKPNKFVKLRSPMRNFSSTWSNPMLKLSMLGIAAFWSAVPHHDFAEHDGHAKHDTFPVDVHLHRNRLHHWCHQCRKVFQELRRNRPYPACRHCLFYHDDCDAVHQ